VLQLPLILPVTQVGILRNHTVINAGIVSRVFVSFGVRGPISTIETLNGKRMTILNPLLLRKCFP